MQRLLIVLLAAACLVSVHCQDGTNVGTHKSKHVNYGSGAASGPASSPASLADVPDEVTLAQLSKLPEMNDRWDRALAIPTLVGNAIKVPRGNINNNINGGQEDLGRFDMSVKVHELFGLQTTRDFDPAGVWQMTTREVPSWFTHPQGTMRWFAVEDRSASEQLVGDFSSHFYQTGDTEALADQGARTATMSHCSPLFAFPQFRLCAVVSLHM
jgi:hypothetical protein